MGVYRIESIDLSNIDCEQLPETVHQVTNTLIF